tara:strand:+ start:448 stop:855 length:408 start_codon:yes stop_codon:yes gene_type:complete
MMAALVAFEEMKARKHTKKEYEKLYNVVKREEMFQKLKESIDKKWEDMERKEMTVREVKETNTNEFMASHLLEISRNCGDVHRVTSTELYKAYRAWCVNNGRLALSHKMFSLDVKRENPNSAKKLNTGMVFDFAV